MEKISISRELAQHLINLLEFHIEYDMEDEKPIDADHAAWLDDLNELKSKLR